jgi:hypothetical protein
VAAYDVDIQLAVKNLNTIKALKKELDAVEQALERISKLDTFDPSGFRARSKARQDEKDQIKDQIRLTNDLKRAESARRADLLRGVRLERQQRREGLQQYTGPIGPGAASPVGGRIRQMQEVEQLTKAAFAAYTQLTSVAKAHDNNVTKIELANDDVVFKQKLAQIDQAADAELKAAKTTNAEALKDFDRRLNNRVTKRKNSLFGDATGKERVGAAVSAGAFPLLFGGGPGMAIGGAFGGAITGSTFGPASIALQVLGGFVDELAAKAATLGQALNLATADVNAVVESLGLVGSPVQDAIQSLEELAGEQVALEEATKQLSLVVGDEGVEALTAFGDVSTRFGNALTKTTTQILAQIARLSGPVVGRITQALEFQTDLSAAKASKDPRQALLQAQLISNEKSLLGDVTGAGLRRQAGIEVEMVGLQRKIKQEEEDRLAVKVETTRIGSVEHVIAKNNLAISKLEGDLTNTRIFNLEKANIMQEAIGKKLEEGADIKLIDIDRDTKLLNLATKRDDQIEAASKRSAAASDKQQRAEERQQRAVERRVKAVDREIERTENAFNKASQQLDSITQKHEDKMAFEREYSRLIMEGSTPAAAKQAVELKKQLLELDRGYEKLLQTVDAQIIKTEASLEDLKNQKGVTTEYDEQLKKLNELKEERDGLKDKKGKAGGAIEEALAPKTFLDKLGTESERLQEILNDLVDPANQVIAAANAIGDAFSESFKGVISGSMTAQEALANLFQRTADHFLDMTAQIIAAAIKMQAIQFVTQIIGSMAGAAASGGGAATPASKAGTLTTGPLPNLGSGPSFGSVNDFKPATILPAAKFAKGGFVSSPTSALIGEGGEPEYVIPASKMRESMSRYSRGSRGNSVIPTNGGGAEDSGGGTAVAAPIDVRYTVERINSVDYVTADQFQSGMQSAAAQGAQRGEQNTLKRLQMSGSTRRRLGM